MATTKREDIIENPVNYIKHYFGQMTQENLQQFLTDSSNQTQNSIQKNFGLLFERELGIEGSLDLRATKIPRLNDCKSVDDLAKLHHKLVRFDCMIQDQYEEEFFVSYLKPKNEGNSQSSNESGHPATSPAFTDGMVYKYFSELTPDEVAYFDCRPDLQGPQRFVQDRGNILGVSVPNINSWVNEVLETGSTKPNSPSNSPSQMSALIKLYDSHINSFKLNEQITFIGVLEFNLANLQSEAQ